MHNIRHIHNLGLHPDVFRGTPYQVGKQTVRHIELEQPATTSKHSHRSPRRNSWFMNTKFMLFMTLISTMTFAIILWYVQAFSAPTAIRTGQAMYRVLKVDMGSALAVLRVTQGFLSTLITIALMKGLELLQWALAGRVHGLGSNVFLGLSSTTPMTEVFRIMISRKSDWTARFWSLIR